MDHYPGIDEVDGFFDQQTMRAIRTEEGKRMELMSTCVSK